MSAPASSSGSNIALHVILSELASRLAQIHAAIKAFEEDTLNALDFKTATQMNSKTYQEFDRALQMQGDIVSLLNFLSAVNDAKCFIDRADLNRSVKLESSCFCNDERSPLGSGDQCLDHSMSKPVEVF